MAGNGGRQSHLCAEKIDGAGLAVVLPKYPATLLLLRRKLVIRIGDYLRHFLPAKLIGVNLWQWAEASVFDARRPKVHELRIRNVLIHGQHRKVGEGREDKAG